MSCVTRTALAMMLACPAAALAQAPSTPTPSSTQPDAVPTTTLPDVVVSATREGEDRVQVPSSITRIDRPEIEFIRPGHPSEILNLVPGVVVQQTNGEGALVGIRQPVNTAPVYLYLQDNVPVQAAGFFNHNALYLLNIPQAASMEVIRGPGTALQGSDAIGGVINVLMPASSPVPTVAGSLEVGSFGWVRGLGTASTTVGNYGFRGDVNITHSDGWRNQTAYDRQALNLRFDWQVSGDTRVVSTLNFGNIYQQTGANSTVSAYDWVHNPTRNYYPIAFRQVQSLMATTMWERSYGDALVTITPYIRSNRMELLPSFTLRNDPSRYVSEYNSLGALLRYRQDFGPWRTRVITGIDMEYSPGSFNEVRIVPTTVNGIMTSYRRTIQLYDYNVAFAQSSPYLHLETSPLPDLRITAGLRFDALGYIYDNNLPSGAFASGLTGASATFYRPGNTNPFYHKLNPNIGFTYTMMPELNFFAGYRQGFRLPQQSDLFRAGVNRNSVNLQPITVENFEAGFRSTTNNPFVWEVVGYYMLKSNDILSYNFNNTTAALTNNGRTRHMGVEVALGWNITPEWRISGTGSASQQEYLEWNTSPTSSFNGRRIPSSPRNTATALLDYRPAWLPGMHLGLDYQHMGGYAMNVVPVNSAATTWYYGGYNMLNARADYQVHPGVRLFGRLMNITNTRWATSASVSGNAPVYAPGMPFQAYGGIAVTF